MQKFTEFLKQTSINSLNSLLTRRILSFGIIGGGLYYVYKYRLNKHSDSMAYSYNEEKVIAKKLTPVLKYKHVENLYDNNTKEYTVVSKLYDLILSELRLKLKPEVYLYQSDNYSLNILPNGALFISDKLYFSVKETGNFNLLTYLIMHCLIHLKLQHTSINLAGLYSKNDLIDQFNNLSSQDTGYEHYFLNYYLYLAYSNAQESLCLKKALYLMEQHNLFICFNQPIVNSMKLLLSDYKRLNSKMQKMNEIGKKDNNLVDNSNKKIKTDEDKISKEVIHGDAFENKIVEVNLHQRTNKTIKYIKKYFPQVHLFNDNLELDVISFIEKTFDLKEKTEFHRHKHLYNSISGPYASEYYETKKDERSLENHKHLEELNKLF